MKNQSIPHADLHELQVPDSGLLAASYNSHTGPSTLGKMLVDPSSLPLQTRMQTFKEKARTRPAMKPRRLSKHVSYDDAGGVRGLKQSKSLLQQ